MNADHRRAGAIALATVLFASIVASAAFAGDDDWPGLHGPGKPIDSMNLDGTTAKVAFLYHAPAGAPKKHIEARVMAEDAKKVTVGLSVWKQDVAFSRYDAKRKTLEVYLLPQHLLDPDEVRIAILQMTPFEAPAGVTTVRVVYLP